MIEKIKSYFFGIKKQVHLNKLGLFEGRIKSDILAKTSWITARPILLQRCQIHFLLMGNNEGPFPTEIKTAEEILYHILKIQSKIESDEKIQSEYPNLNPLDLKEVQVNSWDEDEGIFEMTFIYNASKTVFIGAMYKDGELYDIS